MSLIQYDIPSKEKINFYIIEAKQNNKGPWDKHSLYVGEAAKAIAKRCIDIDEEVAYAMGALHDIGRREGISHMHHIISGYEFMKKEGYECIGNICLSHSFPFQDIREYFGKLDCSDIEKEFIKDYLKNVEYNDYDYNYIQKLIDNKAK